MTLDLNKSFCPSPVKKRGPSKKILKLDQVISWLESGLRCSNIAKKLSVSHRTVTCCGICNVMKSDLSLEEFSNHIKRIYLNLGEK